MFALAGGRLVAGATDELQQAGIALCPAELANPLGGAIVEAAPPKLVGGKAAGVFGELGEQFVEALSNDQEVLVDKRVHLGEARLLGSFRVGRAVGVGAGGGANGCTAGRFVKVRIFDKIIEHLTTAAAVFAFILDYCADELLKRIFLFMEVPQVGVDDDNRGEELVEAFEFRNHRHIHS